MTFSWLWLHLGLILCGLSGLLTAVTTAMLYLLQSAQLKSKHPGNLFFHLPSLDLLDRIHVAALVWGTLLFSLGILSGVLCARDLKEIGQMLSDKKTILSTAACAMYWGILGLRLSSLRRGHKIAVGTVLVFVLLFVAIISSHNISHISGNL